MAKHSVTRTKKVSTFDEPQQTTGIVHKTRTKNRVNPVTDIPISDKLLPTIEVEKNISDNSVIPVKEVPDLEDPLNIVAVLEKKATPQKRVRTLEERLHIIEEVERNPSEKKSNVARRLGLRPSTLNSIIAKKKEIREQAIKCGTLANKRKTGKESIYSELESVLFAWHQEALSLGLPMDGSILREKSLEIAAQMGFQNFSASNGWITRFKQRHGLISKRSTGERENVDNYPNDLWFERLPDLLSCELGSETCMEEGQDGSEDYNNESKSKTVPSFMEALRAFEAVRAYLYAHDITERDQANIANAEILLFSLRKKGVPNKIN